MDYRTLDRWIAELMDCKPLTESEVESLCEKVRAPSRRPALHSTPCSPTVVAAHFFFLLCTPDTPLRLACWPACRLRFGALSLCVA